MLYFQKYYYWYDIEIKTPVNNQFMLIKKCSKRINFMY